MKGIYNRSLLIYLFLGPDSLAVLGIGIFSVFARQKVVLMPKG